MLEAASGCILHRDPASQKCKILPLGKWRTSLKQEHLPPSCNYMLISDYLDMVGVELRSTWTQTRKANGEIIQKRITTTVNPWRSGKFMPLTSRPWSINSFALSKVWFKCCSVDLCVCDITAITSSVKSWLYADLYEKPSELVLFRPISYGGLGMLNPKYRALIRSFLETAPNPNFQRNIFHEQLYRYHVLQEKDLPNPGFPPYYSPDFFSTIRKVKDETPLNVTTMSIKQWSQLLVEDNVTMATLPDNTMEYIPCKAELVNPSTDWKTSWHLARLRGLGPDHTTFLWKVLHLLLPVKERLHRISINTPPYCQLCNQNEIETMSHTFITCTFNMGAGQALVDALRNTMPNINMEKILHLEFYELDEDMEFPVVWFTAAFLFAIWERRSNATRIRKYEIRAEIEGKVSLLRETRFHEHVENLELLCQEIV